MRPRRRMRRSLIQTYYLRRRTTAKNAEGGDVVVWSAPVGLEAVVWPASGRVQAQMYGERLKYIKNMEYSGDEPVQEGDGICVFVDAESDPDYEIKSIKPEYSPIRLELEKIL